MSFSEETLDLIAQGKIDEAHKKFAWALRKDDDDTLYSLAEELYSYGLSTWAKRTYTKLLERYPDEDSLRTALADIAIGEGNDDEALNYLASIQPTSLAYLEALLVAADLYQTQGMFDVSEQKLLTAASLAPDESVIQFALGELYFNTKQYTKAIGCYLDLIKQGILNLSQVNLVQRLGLSYAGAGRFEQALGYLEQIHDDQLDNDTLFQLAFTQLQLDRVDDAERNFKKLIDEDSSYGTAYPYLAQIQEDKGDLAQALRTYEEGLAVDEYNTNLYRKTVEIALKLGKTALAEKLLRQALEQDPQNMTLVVQLSNLLVELKKDTENIQLLKQYLGDDEVDPQLYWNLGRVYARQDQLALAEENYDAARTYLGQQDDFIYDATFFYRNVGRRDDALECINAYLQRHPNDSTMLDLQDQLMYE